MVKRKLGMVLSLPLWLGATMASAEPKDDASSPLNVAVTFSVLGDLVTRVAGTMPTFRC